MKNRLLLIYNPKAGKGQFLTQLPSVIDLFTKAGYAVEVYPTQAAGDCVRKIEAIEGMYDLIVPAGGDGTLDEVVTGLVRSGKKIPIGYIPVGSTNDYAKSLGLSTNIIQAVGDILNGVPKALDVGLVNKNHIFVYVAAFGAFTDVAYTTNQDMKNLFGHIAYFFEASKRLADLKHYQVYVKTEDYENEQDYIFGMITNSISVGGIKNITGTEVQLDDGLFEVTLIRNPKNILEMQEIVGSLITQNYDTDLIDFLKAEEIEIRSKDMIPWTLDGEFGGVFQDVVIENKKQSMQFLLDPKKALVG